MKQETHLNDYPKKISLPIKSAEYYAFSVKLKGSVSELPDKAVCGFAIWWERED